MMKQHTEELVDLYAAGFSLRDIEAITTIPWTTVRSRLVAAGITIRPRGGARKKVDHSAIVETAFLYERLGWSVTEIAEHYGMCQTSIRERLINHGVVLRPRGESMRLRFARRPKGSGAPLVP